MGINKLQILEKQIRKDLPRLTELRKGCKFIYKDENRFEYEIVQEYHLSVKYFKAVCDKNHTIDINEKTDDIKIIGHDILLSDVLEWLEETRPNSNLTIELNRVSSIRKGYSMTLFIQFDDLDCDWYLSKPYLKDQNEELIEFLYDLIEE